MKVGKVDILAHADGVAQTESPAHRDVREVSPTRTSVTKQELRGAIERALTKTEGHRPSSRLVDVLTAQASLETASGDRMYNFNFGGIKGAGPSGMTAVLKTREVLDGKEVVIHDGFRAYRSLDEGALDYVKLLERRFGAALEPASRGDVAGFAAALKKSGYYTASVADYTKGLTSLMGDRGTSAAPAPAHSTNPSIAADEAWRTAQHHSMDLSTLPLDASALRLGAASFPLTSDRLAAVEGALDTNQWLSAMGPSFGTHHRAPELDEEDDS
jgi:hypothetical protein